LAGLGVGILGALRWMMWSCTSAHNVGADVVTMQQPAPHSSSSSPGISLPGISIGPGGIHVGGANGIHVE
jgi:hypothetical protein